MAQVALRRFRSALRAEASKERAAASARFFKSGPGQYGEGDQFLGLTVPDTRSVVRKLGPQLSLSEAVELLQSRYHEERLAALFILVHRYGKADPAGQKQIYEIYMANTAWVNNWDLVDSSAEHIVGAYLQERSQRTLSRLARSPQLWRAADSDHLNIPLYKTGRL